jgi:AraC-like DNA-binding protein
MNISFIQPRPELRPFIRSFWLFESPDGMPAADPSIAAPNGCPKLIVPCENSLESFADGRHQVSYEHGVYFVGNRDTSTVIHSAPRETRFIAIEFCPHGAFPVFGVPMHETVNGLYDSGTVFGKWGRSIRETICNLEDINQKVDFLQDELIRSRNANSIESGLVAYCVGKLELSHGQIPIWKLEQHTGYTARHINHLFRQHVGFSPKVLARVVRFQHFYRQWAQGVTYKALKESLNDHYFDQAHFSREFKRMIGYSPRKFTREVSNEFGRRLAAE